MWKLKIIPVEGWFMQVSFSLGAGVGIAFATQAQGPHTILNLYAAAAAAIVAISSYLVLLLLYLTYYWIRFGRLFEKEG